MVATHVQGYAGVTDFKNVAPLPPCPVFGVTALVLVGRRSNKNPGAVAGLLVVVVPDQRVSSA
jgi:hypothetical protein